MPDRDGDTPTGRNRRAESPAVAADPAAPGMRRPTVRLSRMYDAQQPAASSPRGADASA
jgi:hypothetical protein